MIIRAVRIITVFVCISVSCLLSRQVWASLSPEIIEVTLSPAESTREHKTVGLTAGIPKADVIFAFDLTGSMGDELEVVKAKAIEIMNSLDALIADARYAVMSFMDYPDTYSSCGYDQSYGFFSCDYPYSLDQPMTGDRAAVSTAINALALGCGNDGPENYTRVMFESYADPNVGYRPGARRFLIMFGDNVPHDCDLNEGVPGKEGFFSTGKDPGRDEAVDTEDDLDLQTVLTGMATNNVTMLYIQGAGHFPVDALDYWQYWTGLTGGSAFQLAQASEIPKAIQSLVGAAATHISALTLQVTTPGYEGWLTSVAPEVYTDIDLTSEATVSFDFDIEITAPEGICDGEAGERTHEFIISALGDGASYGDQTAIIHVSCLLAGPIFLGKAPDMQKVDAGGTAVFEISVKNTGEAPLSDVVVTDLQTPECGRVFTFLDIGEEQSYRCEARAVSEDFTNEAIVTAMDPSENTVTAKDTAAVVVKAVKFPVFVRGGRRIADYRMISVPLVLKNPDPVAVFGGSAGKDVDRARWRLLRWRPEAADYAEFGKVPPVAPGVGYWYIASQSRTLSFNGTPIATDKDFILALPPGWSQVGCPFLEPIPWQQVRVRLGGSEFAVGDPSNIWVENVLWGYDRGYVAEDFLKPGAAGWVHNVSDQEVQLVIPAPGAVEISPSAAHSLEGASPTGLSFTLKYRGYRDRSLFLGLGSAASEAWDVRDKMAPPPVSESVPRVYFDHADWAMHPGPYVVDMRPLTASPQVFALTVKLPKTKRAARSKLAWKGVEGIPPHLSVKLMDDVKDRVVDMRKKRHHRIKARGRTSVYPLRVIIE